MATQTVHQRNILMFDGDRDKLTDIIENKAAFSLATKVGFVKLEDDVVGGDQYRLIFPKTIKAKEIDVDSWDYHDREWTINFNTDVELSLDDKVAMVFGPRNGYTPFLECVKNIDSDMQFDLIDFDLDLPNLIKELRKLNPSLTFKTIKVKDYVDDTGLKTNANFKVSGSCDVNKFVDEYEDDIVSFRAEIKVDSETKFAITLDRKGTIKLGGEWPESIYKQIMRLCKQFDQSVAKSGSQAQIVASQAAAMPPPTPQPVLQPS